MKEIVYITEKRMVGETLFVKYSDGIVKAYDAIELGCQWFTMSNDSFYRLYGFNFVPAQYGLYERCRKIVYGRDDK